MKNKLKFDQYQQVQLFLGLPAGKQNLFTGKQNLNDSQIQITNTCSSHANFQNLFSEEFRFHCQTEKSFKTSQCISTEISLIE